MHTASLHIDHFSDLLARLPAGLDLDALAFETKAIERRRAVCGGVDGLRLLLARGPGGLSLSETAAWAGMIGLAELSGPGVKYRINKAADVLDGVVTRLLASADRTVTVHWPGRRVRAADGSGISRHGRQGLDWQGLDWQGLDWQGLDWRVHGIFDLGRGCFSHLALTDCHGAELITRGAPIDGEIRIGDRTYAKAGKLHELRQRSGDKTDVIVRISWRTLVTTLNGQPFAVTNHLATLPWPRCPGHVALATLPDNTAPHEVVVLAKSGRLTPPIRLRLVIVRTLPAAARRKLPRQAQRKQKKLDPRTVIAAGVMIPATSLPGEGYKAEDIGAAYRLRWHIELAFKRLTSLLRIDQLPTRTARASRSWLLAHLSVALLCDDVTQNVLAFPSGPARRGLPAIPVAPARHRGPAAHHRDHWSATAARPDQPRAALAQTSRQSTT